MKIPVYVKSCSSKDINLCIIPGCMDEVWLSCFPVALFEQNILYLCLLKQTFMLDGQ